MRPTLRDYLAAALELLAPVVLFVGLFGGLILMMLHGWWWMVISGLFVFILALVGQEIRAMAVQRAWRRTRPPTLR